MSTPRRLRSFVADPTGSVEVIRADDPRNIDLGATQPLDIPMEPYQVPADDTAAGS